MTFRPTVPAPSALALAFGFILSACTAAPAGSGQSTAAVSPSHGGSSSTPGGSATPAETLPPYLCTLPIQGAATTARAQITDLNVGMHDTYDRIVFDFAAGTPEYRIEKALPPLAQDPSGLPVQVQGVRFLRIVLLGGTTQLPDGGKSYSGAASFTPSFPKLTDLEAAGDFEAVATWYVGMTGDACVRAFTLSAPSRLVIDLQR